MKTRSIGWAALLLMIGLVLAAQSALAQSNPPCGQRSATAFVDWPQAGFDRCRTGYNPNEFLLSPATVGNLVLNWQYTAEDNISSPVVANGIAYVSVSGEWDGY